MVPTLIICLLTFTLVTLSILFLPKIRIGKATLSTYWIVAFLGAILLIAHGYAPIKDVWSELTNNTSINPLKILMLFFSMTIISILLDEFGLFKYLAHLATKRAKSNQYALFFALYALTSILTVFTSNDIVILTLTPFICFFCKRANIKALPYLIAEFFAANTWSLMFLIGNPTNIYLGTAAGINFIEYFKVMAVPTLVAGLTELGILFLLFRKSLQIPFRVTDEDIDTPNKVLISVGVSTLLVCLLFLIIVHYINLEMYMISLACALFLSVFTLIYLCISKQKLTVIQSSYKRLPYELIPFFLSMFVVVVALNQQGITAEISKFLGEKNVIYTYGYSSFLVSNLINNIPMSILYSGVSSSLSGSLFYEATYASIIGSNIGAFLTPIGALAGIMFTSLVNKQSITFRFVDFIRYGVIVSLPTITIALLMLQLFI